MAQRNSLYENWLHKMKMLLWSSSMFALKQIPYCSHTMQTQALQVHTHTITTYLKGLPRDLTNFFNFLFVRCFSVTIPYLCWFPLIVIIEATCTSIILFHFIWFLGSIFAVNYWYWFIKSHNKWFFSFSLSLSPSLYLFMLLQRNATSHKLKIQLPMPLTHTLSYT